MEKLKYLVDKFFSFILKHKVFVIIIFCFVFLFNLTYKIYLFNFKYKDMNDNLRLDVNVQNIKEVTEDKVSYLVKYKNDQFIINIYNNKYSKTTNISKYSIYKYGDVLTLRGKISIPKKLGNPYEFDYKKYLNSNNVVGQISTYEVALKDVRVSNILYKIVYDLKDKISSNIENKMPSREYNLFKSMLYGEDNNLDKDIKENFTKCGLSHLLAVSGSNIAALMFVINYMLKKANSKNNKFVTVFVVFVFSIFCLFELSIIRASIMILISTIYSKKEAKINIYLKILISYIIILSYNPFYIFNIGLLMSYMAILGIVTFQRTIFSYFDIKIKKLLCILYKKPQKIKCFFYYFLYIIFLSFSFTISSLIFLLPIQIYYFNSFSLISFLSNFLISYLDNILAVLGFALLLVSFVPYISNLFSNVCFVILRVIINIINILSTFDILNLKLQTPAILSVIFYYIIIILLKFKKYIIVKIKRKKQYIIKKYILLGSILMIMYIVVSNIYLKYFDNYIIYFNVEQGNMALIHYNSKNIVIDMGSTTERLASNILINYLKKKNIDTIDLLLITHFHTDHINGITKDFLLNTVVEKAVYIPPKEEVKEYNELLRLFEENNISKIEVSQKEEINLNKIDFKFLSPSINTKINDKDIMNANSLVTLVNIKNKNYLFMGDATKSTESYIIKNKLLDTKNIEVLQVGHHGSDTSSSDEFLDIYNIKMGLISSKKKVYNHPSEKTLNRFNNHKIPVKITEKNGAYKIKI